MKNKGGRKRTFKQLARDRQIIADLYCKGWYQSDISNHINGIRDYDISRQTVANDIKAIRKEWKKKTLMDFSAKVDEELAKIDNLERTYWAAWEESKMTRTESGKSRSADGQSSDEASYREQTGPGDPRFLAGAERCVDRRINLLDLEPIKRIEHSGPEGMPISVMSLEGLNKAEMNQVIANLLLDIQQEDEQESIVH